MSATHRAENNLQAGQRRLAGAPISWGVCEVPGWGLQLPPERVLSEMAGLGLTATELGPQGWLPPNGAQTRAVLDRCGLRLVGGFVPVVVHEADVSATLEDARRAAAQLAAAGADVFVAAAVQDATWSAPVALGDDGWERAGAHLREVADIAAAEDLTLVLHPHVGTLLETADDVERALAHTDVPWCLDTGHLLIGGVDPVQFVRGHASRIAHVHLKDVDATLAGRVRRGELSLVTATRDGLFQPLGHGDARIDEVVRLLDDVGYERWLVLEQDRAITGSEPQADGGPALDVGKSIEFLSTPAPRSERLDAHDATDRNPPRRRAGRLGVRRCRMNAVTEAGRAEAARRGARRRIGVGVIGFGWLGQAHSRSLLRIPTLFPERSFDAELVVCGDTLPERRDQAVGSFGFGRAAADWRTVVEDPAVDVVFVAAPNMLHVELVEAAAAAGKHVFCEKPVGGTPEQTVRAERAAREANVISGVGYNYRWAPLVLYARRLIADGHLGEITNYRGRFFSMYGSDPLGVLSWRFLVDQAGHGVTTDLMSHSVDLAHMLLGPITRVVGTTETFIRERPIPVAGGTHYGRGRPDDPTGAVTNEDYAAMLCEFVSGVRGTFEASRSIVGPESQMAFEVYGTKGALAWNLEKLNELQVYLVEDELHTGYRTVYGGDRFPYHGNFVPGSANGIGFEDLVVIEDYEFCRSVAEGREHHPDFGDAVEWVSVQAALLRSAESGQWENVVSLREH